METTAEVQDDEQHENRDQWEFCNIYFEQYYKRVLAQDFEDDSEYERFLEVAKTRLPTTLRINEAYPNYKLFAKLLTDTEHLKKHYLKLDGIPTFIQT